MVIMGYTIRGVRFLNKAPGPAGRHRRKKIYLSAALILLFFILISVLSSRVYERKKLQAQESATKAAKALPVKVMEISAVDLARHVRSSAVVEAWQEAIISTEVSGKVNLLHAKVGDELEPGSPILHIDDEMLGYQVEDAEGRVLQLEAGYQRSKNDLQRKEALYTDNVISAFEIEQARAEEKSARGLLTSAQAALKIAQRNFRKAVIRSPIRGTLAERSVDLGTDIVQGQQVASVVYIDRLKLTIGAAEQEKALIAVGQPVQITTQSYPDRTFRGTVYSFGIKADDDTLTFPVEIIVENNQGPLLTPGMVTRVAVQTAAHRGVIAIPRGILEKTSSGLSAWHVQDDKARRLTVEAGESIGQQIIIKKGLTPGMKLITFGYQNLYNDCPVTIIEQPVP